MRRRSAGNRRPRMSRRIYRRLRRSFSTCPLFFSSAARVKAVWATAEPESSLAVSVTVVRVPEELTRATPVEPSFSFSFYLGKDSGSSLYLDTRVPCQKVLIAGREKLEAGQGFGTSHLDPLGEFGKSQACGLPDEFRPGRQGLNEPVDLRAVAARMQTNIFLNP